MTQKGRLLSGRVPTTSPTKVTSDRYQFMGLDQAEPNLGISSNGNVLTTNISGTRIWSNSIQLANITVSNVQTNTMVISSGIFWANGLPFSSFGNLDVSGLLPTYTGNISAGNIVVSGNISAAYILGDGSKITNTYSNVSVSNYLPTFNGNLTPYSVTSNLYGNISADLIAPYKTSVTVFNSNTAIRLPVGSTSTRPITNVTGYLRFNTDTSSPEYFDGAVWSNMRTSTTASGQTFNGDGSTTTYPLNQNTNATGILVSINGTVQQPTTAYTVVTVSGNSSIIFSEVPLSSDLVDIRFLGAMVSIATNVDVLVVASNISAPNYFFSNGVNILSALTAGTVTQSVIDAISANIGTFSILANANAAIQQTSINSINANLGTATTNITALQANVGAYELYANATLNTATTNITALQANLGSYELTTNANLGTATTNITALQANVGAYELYANANLGTATTNITALQANIGAYELYANANLGTATTNITVLQANIGAYELYANANAAVQQTQISTLQANVGAYELYANANLGTATTNITALQANVGVAATSINTLQANVGAYEIYANAMSVSQQTQILNLVTSANANTLAYLASGISPVTIANVLPATVANTGALQVWGGASIGANLYVGGSLIVAGNTYELQTEIISQSVIVAANVTAAAFFYSNGAAFAPNSTDIITLYSNAASQQTSLNSINANLGTATTNISVLQANLGTATTNISTLQANVGAFEAYANTTFGTATSTNVTNLWANIYAISANLGSYEIATNANLGTATTNITTLFVNLGAYSSYANANLGTATTNITALQANVGAFESYANTAFGTATSTNVTNLWANIYAISANLGSYEIATNANLGTATTNITTLFSNVGAHQTSLNGINANVGSFESYANIQFGLRNTANSAVSTSTLFTDVDPGNYDSEQLLILSNQNYITGASFAPGDNRIITAGIGPGKRPFIRTGGSIQLELSSAAVVVSGTSPTTSTTTGALIVTGGVGINGSLNVNTGISTGGNLIISGSGEFNNLPGSGGQFILKNNGISSTGYGVIHRHDGSNYYVLLTNNNDANGTWNAFRPLTINVSTGNVALSSTTFSGTASPASNISASLGSVSTMWDTMYSRDIQSQTANISGTINASGTRGIRFNGAGGTLFWLDNPTTNTFRISSGATPGSNPMTYDSIGNVVINATTVATTVNTGALVVKGGIGVSGNIYASGVFSGNGAALSSLNASNLSTGAISALLVPTLNQNTTGSAATLTTSRNINGIAFNGGSDITIAAAANTLSGSTLASGVTASSLTSIGTLSGLTVSGNATFNSNVAVNGILQIPSGSYGVCELKTGTGDGASYTIYNTAIRSWWGIGFRDYTDNNTVKLFIDCRTGSISSIGTVHAATLNAPSVITSTISNGGTAIAITEIINASGLIVGKTNTGGPVSMSSETGSISIKGDNFNAASMSFHRPGNYAINMGLDVDNIFKIGGWSASANIFQLTGSGALTITSAITSTLGQINANNLLLQGDGTNAYIRPTNAGSNLYLGANNVTYTTLDSGGKITHNGHIVPAANVTYNLGSTTAQWNIVYGKAIQAQYADLAEKYITDIEYEVGTVVTPGGEFEVTAAEYGQRAIGAISANPAYLMNSASHGQAVALKGRVPVKVIGAIKKGDRLVPSQNTPGVAQKAVTSDERIDTFAVSLETNLDPGLKLIESVIL